MEAEIFDQPPVDWPIDESADTDSANHSALLATIQRITSKNRSASTNQLRTESAANISEFYAPPNDTTTASDQNEADEDIPRAGGPSVHALLDSLGDRRQLATLRKQLNKSKRQKTLTQPADTRQAVRQERVAGYSRALRHTTRWQSVIEQRRRSAQLRFPLHPASLRVETAREISESADRWRSPLEQQIAKLLASSDAVPSQDESLSVREQRVLAAMSLEQALERRHELAKNRALLTYQEARGRRQNRIKSRRYRRSVKQYAVRQHLAEFERVRVCDPEAAQAMLKRVEERRVEERATQRHRLAGRWARGHALRRRYCDPEAKRALEESLRLARELKQKQDASGDGDQEEQQDEEEEEDEEMDHVGEVDSDNPWMSGGGGEKNSDPPLLSSTASHSATDETRDYMEEYSRQEAIKQLMRQSERECDDEDEEETDEKLASHVVGHGIRHNPNLVTPSHTQKKRDEQIERRSKKELKKVHFVDEKNEVRTSKPNKKLQTVDEIFDTLNHKTTKQPKKFKKKKRKSSAETRESAISDDSRENEEEDAPTNTETNIDPSSNRLPLSNHSESAEERVQRAVDRLLQEDDVVNVEEQKKKRGVSTVPGSANKPLTAVKHAAMPDLCIDTYSLLDQDQDQEMAGSGDQRSSTNHRLTLAEAFADDDVLAEFKREKRKQSEADQPKDVDLALPGWGEWGGESIRPSSKQRRRRHHHLRIRAPRLARRDRQMAHVILSENANAGARSHQVSQLPHYTSAVAAFEAEIRAPIGRTWLPARAHSQLVRPAVVTRPGVNIEPMDESMLLVNKDGGKRSRKPGL